MAYLTSPGIAVREREQQQYVPAVSTSVGATVGNFIWGEVEVPTLLSSERELVETFGKPTNETFLSFFSASNFLAYSSALYVVRTVCDQDDALTQPAKVSALNATAKGTGILVKNKDKYLELLGSAITNGTTGSWVARCPSTLGNSIAVSVIDSTEDFATYEAAVWGEAGQKFSAIFNGRPGTSAYTKTRGGENDEMHIIVWDKGGMITGTRGTILETYAFVSKARDAKTLDGNSNYYVNVVNDTSKYVFWGAHPTSKTVTGYTGTFGSESVNTKFVYLQLDAPVTQSQTTTLYGVTVTLGGGKDGSAVSDGDMTRAWDWLKNPETYKFGLAIAGGHSTEVSKYVIDNIAAVRKDCVAFVSPKLSDLEGSGIPEKIKVTRTAYGSSSYAFMDSGWKYQYDRFNDTYRWMPLNPDIAGTCAYTDQSTDPWFSNAGFERGVIRNIVKLKYSPSQADRDILYRYSINPVVTFPGSGTVLYGDKTLMDRPSTFDRINVRRLFITLENSIAEASRSQLFEFNDEFTRAQFKNLVEPFLRDVQGRRGITEFKVVCDTSNNTPQVINSNNFVADIFVRPARSINFITLNFIATAEGVSFNYSE